MQIWCITKKMAEKLIPFRFCQCQVALKHIIVAKPLMKSWCLLQRTLLMRFYPHHLLGNASIRHTVNPVHSLHTNTSKRKHAEEQILSLHKSHKNHQVLSSNLGTLCSFHSMLCWCCCFDQQGKINLSGSSAARTTTPCLCLPCPEASSDIIKQSRCNELEGSI
jgi:hypothetical protein